MAGWPARSCAVPIGRTGEIVWTSAGLGAGVGRPEATGHQEGRALAPGSVADLDICGCPVTLVRTARSRAGVPAPLPSILDPLLSVTPGKKIGRAPLTGPPAWQALVPVAGGWRPFAPAPKTTILVVAAGTRPRTK